MHLISTLFKVRKEAREFCCPDFGVIGTSIDPATTSMTLLAESSLSALDEFHSSLLQVARAALTAGPIEVQAAASVFLAADSALACLLLQVTDVWASCGEFIGEDYVRACFLVSTVHANNLEADQSSVSWFIRVVQGVLLLPVTGDGVSRIPL